MNTPPADEEGKEGFGESWRAAVIEMAISYVVNHPIRLDCLAILIVRVASPSEIASELGISTASAAHHVGELYKDGVVEFVKHEMGGSRRGGTEHYYRATALPEVTDEDWKQMPDDCRRRMAGRVLQAIVAQSLAALRYQTMERDDQLHLGWQAIPVDSEGEEEMATLLEDASRDAMQIKMRNQKRLADAGGNGRIRIVALLGFWRGDPTAWPGRSKIDG